MKRYVRYFGNSAFGYQPGQGKPVVQVHTKEVCAICNDHGDEEFMLGMCCGRRLTVRPLTSEEYHRKRQQRIAKKRILERARKLGW